MRKIDLEGEQYDAFSACVNHILDPSDGKQILRFGAFAGTGKTYTLRHVITFLAEFGVTDVAVVAFCGRAAAQLNDAGVTGATTCHALLYKPVFNEHGVMTGFKKKDRNEIIAICGSGIIVDESSMIPEEMFNDLMAIGVKIIFAGDAAQLEPVTRGANNSIFNVMETIKPPVEVTLVENRRFDVNNGIGFITLHLRTQNSFPRVKKDALVYTTQQDVSMVKFHRDNQFDVVLCGTNNRRKKINQLIRIARGYTDDIPEVGERIVCLRNTVLENGESFNNGELYEVTAVFPGEFRSKYIVKSEKGRMSTISVLNEVWHTEDLPYERNKKDMKDPAMVFGFGYCLSVHKSQGSTFERVLFVDEDVSFFLDRKKFRYTGCSRAAKELWVAL